MERQEQNTGLVLRHTTSGQTEVWWPEGGWETYVHGAFDEGEIDLGVDIDDLEKVAAVNDLLSRAAKAEDEASKMIAINAITEFMASKPGC